MIFYIQKKIALVFFLMIPLAISAQESWQKIIETKMPELPITCQLYQIGKFHEFDRVQASKKLNGMNMVIRDDGKINAEIVYGDDFNKSIDKEYLSSLEIEVKSTWKNRASIWLSIEELIPLATKLKSNYFISAVYYPSTNNQGPLLMNSDSYLSDGVNGAGINIAIFDAGFTGLENVINSGNAPSVIHYDHTGGDNIEDGNEVHGTACLETVFDHASGANYFVHKISSPTDFGNAINQAINDQVDIISHSLGWNNMGWEDNSGAICNAVEDASNDGILFFTSVGNYNGKHWQGSWSDTDDDLWHNFSLNDEGNNFTVPGLGTVKLDLQWEASNGTNCYDLYLFDTDNNIIASSTNNLDFETISWTNPNNIPQDVYFAVGDAGYYLKPDFEVFCYRSQGNIQFYTTGSIPSPANSTAANCISVGAVSREFWEVGAIELYSSLGPTNSGNIAPDICAPTLTTTVSYFGDFSGTSCSAPNAAGAAAVFWSAHPDIIAFNVKEILFRKAELFNDWGPNGKDNIFGHGGLELYNYYPNTVYIYDYPGIQLPFLQPYPHLSSADLNAPNGSRAIILGGTFNVSIDNPIILNRPMTYRSLIKSSTVE